MEAYQLDRREFKLQPLASGSSPLIKFVLKGLDNCWLPEHGRWSHKYHLDGRTPANESVPESDVFYTLNVLLGLSRLDNGSDSVRAMLREVFDRNAPLVMTLPVPKYAYGMVLWSAAELGFEVPPTVERHIRRFLDDRSNWENFHAQDLGMILTGVCAQAKKAPDRWNDYAVDLFALLNDRFTTKSGLFLDAAKGLRARFGSFATQTYLTIACYTFGAQFQHRGAMDLAFAATRKLIALQGPQGEWPWFFDAPKGIVVDFYEVYSVHQDGMAPAFLELAEANGFGSSATEALRKGFMWIYGENQLEKSMLVPDLGLIYRSQVRQGELDGKSRRVVRAVQNALIGRSTGLTDPSEVALRKECRSYHLGWVIWAFARRMDMPGVTHNPMLSE